MNWVYRCWNHYWFRPAPLVNIAVLRIISVAFALLSTLFLSNKVTRALQLVDLPDGLYQPPLILRLLTLTLKQAEKPSRDLVLIFTLILVIFGLSALMGFKTNFSLMFFSLGYLFLNALNYSFGEFHHRQSIMMISLFILSLSPCGKVISIDHWMNLRQSGPSGKPDPAFCSLDLTSPYAYWPPKLIQWMFALIYLSAATAKIFKGGLDWANGYTLQFYLLDSGVRRTTPLGLWLGQQHSLAVIFSVVTLVFESTFWLVPLFPRLAWIYLPIGIGMHLGIYLTMRADFFEFIVLYAAFISWAVVLKSISKYFHRLAQIQLPRSPPNCVSPDKKAPASITEPGANFSSNLP